MVRMLQGLLYIPLSDEKDLSAMGLEQLDSLTAGLQEKLRSRNPAVVHRLRQATAVLREVPGRE